MLQVSRQLLWRPSGTRHLLALSVFPPRVGYRVLLTTSCSTSLQPPQEDSCNRLVQFGWAQNRPSAVSWCIREAHTGTAGKSHGRRKKSIKPSSLQYANRGDELEARDAEDATEEIEERDSKGQSKRKALRSKEWGVQLASLSPAQLRQAIRWASLSEEVYDAVMLVKSLGPKVRNGKRRQYSYIGGLLREADPDLMEQVLKACIDGDPPGSLASSAPESSEDEFSDDEETDSISQEDLSAQNTAQLWLEGLLGGNNAVTYEVFSNPSDVYFDRQELRRLMRVANQTRDAVSSQEVASSGGDDEPLMSSEDTVSSIEVAAPAGDGKPRVSSKELSKAAKNAQTALYRFLYDLARRQLHESQSLEV